MKRYTWRTGVLEGWMILVAIAFAFPLYVLVNLSIRRDGDVSSPLLPTTRPTLGNLTDAWSQASLGKAMLTSALIAVVSVVVIVVFSSMAAFAFARVTSRLSTAAFWLVMAGLLVPFQTVLIPLYMTIRDINLLGTVWSLVIFYVGFQMPFSIFLYTGFLRALPQSYEEAARIDGAGPLQLFWRVVFPMLRPITGTVVILNAIHIWNDFLTPLLYLSGSGNETIPVAIFSFIDQYVSDWPLVFSGLIIGVAPILLVFFALQRHVLKGFAGGLKG